MLFWALSYPLRVCGKDFIPRPFLFESDILYIFSLTGSPGSIFFFIPSSPAATITENARYGLEDGSGALNSIRFDLKLFFSFTGIRTTADLFALAHAI